MDKGTASKPLASSVTASCFIARLPQDVLRSHKLKVRSPNLPPFSEKRLRRFSPMTLRSESRNSPKPRIPEDKTQSNPAAETPSVVSSVPAPTPSPYMGTELNFQKTPPEIPAEPSSPLHLLLVSRVISWW